MSYKARRYQKRNRHHLTPRSRSRERGERPNDSINNLLLIDIERHIAWHKLFKNLDLDEVIELLLRVQRAKRAQKEAA